jgi:uncharacterized protein with HEPN domain
MFDRELVISILGQIDEALEKIKARTAHIQNAAFFTDSSEGMEKLDSVSMLLIAIGESLKNIDKITGGVFCRDTPKSTGQAQKNFATS